MYPARPAQSGEKKAESLRSMFHSTFFAAAG
jgi:hypothetical protein